MKLSKKLLSCAISICFAIASVSSIASTSIEPEDIRSIAAVVGLPDGYEDSITVMKDGNVTHIFVEVADDAEAEKIANAMHQHDVENDRNVALQSDEEIERNVSAHSHSWKYQTTYVTHLTDYNRICTKHSIKNVYKCSGWFCSETDNRYSTSEGCGIKFK